MYCVNCGKVISDNIRFCQYCGCKVNGDNNTINIKHSTDVLGTVTKNKILNNEAVRIYVNDILNCEVALEVLEEKKQRFQEDIDRNSENVGRKFYQIYNDRNYYLKLMWKENKVYILKVYKRKDHNIHLGVLVDFDEIPWTMMNRVYWKEIDIKEYKKLSKSGLLGVSGDWCRGYTYNRIAEEESISGLQEDYRSKDARDTFLEAYEDMRNNGESYYNDDIQYINSLKKNIVDIDNLITEGKRNLSNLYGLNIIPAIYRNIYSIYFINDYIQSSNERISEAFLHLDLNTIKRQLSDVINAQKEMIFQQSVMISQNDELLEENSHMLKQLAKMEENIQTGNQYLQSVNQYARIAEENISTCRWLAELATFERITRN